MNQIKKKFIRFPNLSVVESMHEIGRNPFVDWILILFISCVIAILLVLGGISLYGRVVSGDIQSPDVTNSSTIKVFNVNDLSDIIGRFDAKKDLELQARRGYSGPSDPSQ